MNDASKLTSSFPSILVTTALPYANGPIHLGHLVEYIQADCWVRSRRMEGCDMTFVCADDAHGTPVMLRAEAEQQNPEELIEWVRREHLADFMDFGIAFNHYHSTHSPENRHFSEKIYHALQEQGFIDIRTIEQYYDTVKGLFLPDRFIKGRCPKCHASDQYGDSCEVCGAAYSSDELIEPYSTLSRTPPIKKQSDHYFFRLSEQRCYAFLKSWVNEGHLQSEAVNKVREWLGNDKLSDWDISRDGPYFGFQIPNTTDKYFYVWLDAPIGYIASFANSLIASENLESWQAAVKHEKVQYYWGENAPSELYHFIGKDILYFHALFWPAMLHFSGHRTPTEIFVHGFLTVNGQKMSKSRGTFITARHYLDVGINPEYLRYFFASRLSTHIEDIDLSLHDFEQKINSDLIGKTVNIASRASPFLHKRFAGCLFPTLIDHDFQTALPEFNDLVKTVSKYYREREFSKAIRCIMHAADAANRYCDEQKPWELAKQVGQNTHLHKVTTLLINAFRLLVLCLKPVMPRFACNAEQFLNIPPMLWEDGVSLLPPAHSLNPYQHLLKRLDSKKVMQLTMPETTLLPPSRKKNMNEPSTAIQNATDQKVVQQAPSSETALPTISIDDFSKLDLRIAEIISAEAVENSDKLIKLNVTLGQNDERVIFAGIKAHYDPTRLVGKKVVVVANLAPRKMRFGVSEGMVLAASFSNQQGEIIVIEPEGGSNSSAQAGMKVS